MTLQTIEDFIYKIPIVLLFAVPVIILLMIVFGPLFRRYRYNRVGMAAIVAAIAVTAYVIYYYLNGLQ